MKEFVDAIFQTKHSFLATLQRHRGRALTWKDSRIIGDWSRTRSVQVGDEVLCGGQVEAYYEKIVAYLTSKTIQNPEETACELMIRQYQNNEFSHRFLPAILGLLPHLIETRSLLRNTLWIWVFPNPRFASLLATEYASSNAVASTATNHPKKLPWRFLRVVVQNVLDPAAHIEDQWTVSTRNDPLQCRRDR